MKFKVGDAVKVIKNEGGSVNNIGDIGVITRIDNLIYQVMVDDNDTEGNWHWEDELALSNNIK